MPNVNEIWCLLTSHGKLERDRGVEILKEICNSFNTDKTDVVNISEQSSNSIDQLLPDIVLSGIFEKLVQYPLSLDETPWETKLGILIGCQVFNILSSYNSRSCRNS